MNILEFIETQYPIKDKIRLKLEDPYKRIEGSDNLPYDVIGPDENGVITKLIEVEEGRFISVMALISLDEKMLMESKDEPLKDVWETYMSQIDLQDMNIADIFDCVKQYQNIVNSREDKLSVLSI